jgi:hypothetical protein
MRSRYLLATLALLATPLMAQEKPADNMQLVRDKLKADKKLLVAENMGLTETEAKAFWPVYDAFQADNAKLNDRAATLIKNYAANYKAMSDAAATQLLDEFVAIDRDRSALLASYRSKFSAAIPPLKVARYYQIENKIRAVINYELASAIPLM